MVNSSTVAAKPYVDMSGLPDNLKPLPTQPWDNRPLELPLDREEVRTAVWRASGNITRAAQLLKVSPSRLRTFVRKSEYLQQEVEEAKEQLVDTAEDVIRDALEDPERQDAAARFVLSTIGRSRGWGTGGGAVQINNKGGNIVFQWADGTSMSTSQEPQTIDVTPENVDG